MPVHPSLVQIATRQQVLLEQLKTGQVRNFLKVFNQVGAEIRRVLRSLEIDTIDALSRTKLEKLIGELADIQVTLFDKQIKALEDGTGEISTYISELEVKVLRSVASKSQIKNITFPSADKVSAEVWKRPVQATGDKLGDFFKNWSASSVRRTNNAIRIAYEQGRTVPEVIRQLIGTDSLKFKDGLLAVSKRDAATVVRTSIQHVAATARSVTYEQNSDLVEGYQWVSTLDSNTTSKCRSLDGQKFDLGAGPVPPIHPNCRSTTTPSLIKEFDFLDKGATRSSEGGYVSADTTYYDWLKNQNEEFQDQVLGATRGKLFREGGLSVERFRALQLDKNFEPITLDEMRELEPLAFKRADL
jgi:SPP1 gp7 family putative phage head morphogenesis protein